jgi:hypothetical protein
MSRNFGFSQGILASMLSGRRTFRLSLLGGLLAVALVVVPAAPAAASPRLCFYVQQRQVFGASNTGHAFVQLLPDAGSQNGRRNLVYGFYPKHTFLAVTGGPGEVNSDATRGWNWKLCQYVDRTKYDAAADLVTHDISHPPKYSLFGFNCTDWIFKVAGKAGVTLPSAKALGTNLFDPEKLADNMKELWVQQGSRNIPGANGVFKQPGNLSPTNALDPPIGRLDPDSYTDLTLLARTAPHLLARGLDMTAHVQSLPAARLGVGKRLSITVSTSGHHPAVTEVWFGDGAHAVQKHSFVHTYAHPGHFHLVGIAIANATILRFSLAITVDRASGGVARAVTVPRDPTHPAHFKPLPPPIVPLPE